MAEELAVRDPIKGQKLTIKVVPRSAIEVIAHQRKPRPAHLKALSSSMERVGYLTPLVVVERDGRFVVIDGNTGCRSPPTSGSSSSPSWSCPGPSPGG
ncbi:MAG TPA: ParB N-terminal domain-containing protein [Acidimicrobiales bacterium]|nr:ParB N-terminal domain-containing protein [Acidimicrobiales bacterium]